MTVQIAANSTKLKEKAVSKVDLSSNWPSAYPNRRLLSLLVFHITTVIFGRVGFCGTSQVEGSVPGVARSGPILDLNRIEVRPSRKLVKIFLEPQMKDLI